MEHTYWHKQTSGQPLFPELLWSRPENKNQAGKVLIIGGNQYGFAAPAEAYEATAKTGVGMARVLLPLAIKKVAGKLLPELEYAASTPSGSFALLALGEFLDQAAWADSLLLAGDLGRNSETAVLLESFVSKYQGPLTITKDAADYFLATPKLILARKDTLLVLTMAQLQKLVIGIKYQKSFRLGMDLMQLVDGLHDFTTNYGVKIIVKHLDQLIVSVDGQISTTKLSQDLEIWRVKTASIANVWWLQNTSQPFQALTSAVYETI